jgi:hypothetical protein
MYHSLLPLAVTSSPNPNSSIEKPVEPSEVRGWLGPRASVCAIPAVNRTTISLFSSPQSGCYTRYNFSGPNRCESTCNFVD